MHRSLKNTILFHDYLKYHKTIKAICNSWHQRNRTIDRLLCIVKTKKLKYEIYGSHGIQQQHKAEALSLWHPSSPSLVWQPRRHRA